MAPEQDRTRNNTTQKAFRRHQSLCTTTPAQMQTTGAGGETGALTTEEAGDDESAIELLAVKPLVSVANPWQHRTSPER